jgi:VIT1/CCC1 family predicted Fe2+/Mn2+ transporter
MGTKKGGEIMQEEDKPRKHRQHKERHFMASELVHNIVIGMSDGLTVPFAIAAGLSGSDVSTRIVIIGGLSEIAAGSISMGLGGYLSGRTDLEHYNREHKREKKETEDIPDQELREVEDILKDFGLEDDQSKPVAKAISKDKDRWIDFMMRFELGLDKPDPHRALRSALTIGLSYAFSGFIPLSPYFGVSTVHTALYISVAVTLTALFVFGFLKGRVMGINALRSGLQTLLIGGVAAGAAFIIARLI